MTEILKLTPEDKVINFIAQCFAFNMPFTVSDIAKYTGLKSGHVSGLLPDDLIEKISEGGANGRRSVLLFKVSDGVEWRDFITPPLSADEIRNERPVARGLRQSHLDTRSVKHYVPKYPQSFYEGDSGGLGDHPADI